MFQDVGNSQERQGRANADLLVRDLGVNSDDNEQRRQSQFTLNKASGIHLAKILDDLGHDECCRGHEVHSQPERDELRLLTRRTHSVRQDNQHTDSRSDPDEALHDSAPAERRDVLHSVSEDDDTRADQDQAGCLNDHLPRGDGAHGVVHLLHGLGDSRESNANGDSGGHDALRRNLSQDPQRGRQNTDSCRINEERFGLYLAGGRFHTLGVSVNDTLNAVADSSPPLKRLFHCLEGVDRLLGQDDERSQSTAFDEVVEESLPVAILELVEKAAEDRFERVLDLAADEHRELSKLG